MMAAHSIVSRILRYHNLAGLSCIPWRNRLMNAERGRGELNSETAATGSSFGCVGRR